MESRKDEFSWLPIYSEIASKLLEWKDRQGELISLLQSIRDKGYIVTPLNDKNDPSGEKFLMTEIDPFTFFGTFNRGTKTEHRLGILAELKKFFDCQSELPTDFSGIPILNNQRSWFISYQHNRKPDDVERLWRVFELAQGPDPLETQEFLDAYDQALDVRGVNVNLTMGLFWIRPNTFLNMDSTNRSFLKIPAKAHDSAAEYKKAVVAVRNAHTESFPELSLKAYQNKGEQDFDSPDGKVTGEKNYWFVGAYWSTRDPKDQTQRFLEEGIWVNGYKDRFIDEVKQMQVGERIAIKSVGTQKKNLPFDAKGHTVSRMTIKARGTIVANRGDGRTVEVEWDPDFEPREWYHFTGRTTVWRIALKEDYTNKHYGERLVRFTFHDEPQDYQWFSEKWYGDDSQEEADEDSGTTSPYSIDDIIEEGAFLSRDELEQMLLKLRQKKNLILQGAPGVGKTFIAQRLAFALMEESSFERTRFVQFHQSYSYEDFVRGYRPLPQKAGSFGLKDGVFFEFCKVAREDPDQDYVLLIDEINRGNLSQIFGELLMLIEGDKRKQRFAIPLMYTREDEADFYVPNNLYIIGMMNLADRSLALVDYALRRRFAFKTLEPKFESKAFRDWLEERSVESNLIDLIVSRFGELNKQIADDELLGPNYVVGHSYFCPSDGHSITLDRSWFDSVIESEIVPLLQEYWFDSREKLQKARDQLLAK